MKPDYPIIECLPILQPDGSVVYEPVKVFTTKVNSTIDTEYCLDQMNKTTKECLDKQVERALRDFA